MNDIETLITSPLSGKVTRNGMTVEIIIYRGEEDRYWRVVFVDHEGAPASWPYNFATEQDALDEVIRTIDREGIGNFLRDTEQTPH